MFRSATVEANRYRRPLWPGGPPQELPNDYVFVFAGGVLPTGFLAACGIEIDTKFGDP